MKRLRSATHRVIWQASSRVGTWTQVLDLNPPPSPLYSLACPLGPVLPLPSRHSPAVSYYRLSHLFHQRLPRESGRLCPVPALHRPLVSEGEWCLEHTYREKWRWLPDELVILHLKFLLGLRLSTFSLPPLGIYVIRKHAAENQLSQDH